jgi:hypothetical protein
MTWTSKVKGTRMNQSRDNTKYLELVIMEYLDGISRRSPMGIIRGFRCVNETNSTSFGWSKWKLLIIYEF